MRTDASLIVCRQIAVCTGCVWIYEVGYALYWVKFRQIVLICDCVKIYWMFLLEAPYNPFFLRLSMPMPSIIIIVLLFFLYKGMEARVAL